MTYSCRGTAWFQTPSIRSGRLDAGFVFNMPKGDAERDQVLVALHKLVLGVPKGLALVACRLGVAFVSDATRWRCPKHVLLRPVVDLQLPIAFSLVWRKDNAAVACQIRG